MTPLGIFLVFNEAAELSFPHPLDEVGVKNPIRSPAALYSCTFQLKITLGTDDHLWPFHRGATSIFHLNFHKEADGIIYEASLFHQSF